MIFRRQSTKKESPTRRSSNRQPTKSFLTLFRNKATANSGEEIAELEQESTNESEVSTDSESQAEQPENEEEEVIVFQDKLNFMIEPDILVTPTKQQDCQLFPTLQLLEPQNVKVIEPLEAVLSVFRQQLVEESSKQKIEPEIKKISITPKAKVVRPPRRLLSTEEIQYRMKIERKLSLIRKGRFVPPSGTMRTPPLTAAAC